MTHLSQYADQAVAHHTTVFGNLVDDKMQPADVALIIQGHNGEIAHLEEQNKAIKTATGKTSVFFDERISELRAANEVLVDHLDSFAKANAKKTCDCPPPPQA